MNLVLSFVHPTKPARDVGPFQSISLDAQTVRDASTEDVIARHRDHQWEVDGQGYYRVDATSGVRIHFERSQPHPQPPTASREFGPFSKFSAVDSIAYADDLLFAFLDARVGGWFCYQDGLHWPLMIVSDATPRSGLVAA